MVKRLANAIHGEVCTYTWDRPSHSGDSRVAVKKLLTHQVERIRQTALSTEREMHLNPKEAKNPEDALAEIGILSYLCGQPDSPIYLLKMIAVFTEGRHTWLVTECAQGGELFDVVASGPPLAESQVRWYTWQLLSAVAYLHLHCIGHRDISLENILLDTDHNNGNAVIKLIDFGMAVRSHSASGAPLRFFRAVGKDFYRAPECYVPAGSKARVVAPCGATPGDVILVPVGSVLTEVRLPETVTAGQVCIADHWGYEAQSADQFAVAVCMFILAWQSPMWHQATLADPSFSFVRSHVHGGPEALLVSWGKKPLSSNAMGLLTDMAQIVPAERPTAAKCLDHPWFAGMDDVQAPSSTDHAFVEPLAVLGGA
jgi:serine/threonine protein kinase